MTRAGDTAAALGRLTAPLRGWSGAGWTALAVGGALLVLGAAGWLARWLNPAGPAWVLAAWVGAGIALIAVIPPAIATAHRLGAAAVARRLENEGSWRRGALTGLLGGVADGTSAALLTAADRARALDLAQHGHRALAPLRRQLRSRLLAGAACLTVGALLIGSAGPRRQPVAALWHPARAVGLLRAPVRLTASALEVDRGGSITVTVDAPGRTGATLWLRSPGEAWRRTAVTLDTTGHAGLRLGPLTSDLFARAASGNRESDTLHVTVRLPVFLGALTVTAHYPRYLAIDPEPIPTEGDTVVVPAGTRLETGGQATTPLAGARWRGPDGAHPLTVDARTFRGSFVPVRSGGYELALSAADGSPAASEAPSLVLRVLPDSAPVVAIPVPGRDTLAPLDLVVPLVVDARDDHGVQRVLLESRRISRLGIADTVRREPLMLPPGTTDRAILTVMLDLNKRGLLPGDTVRYRAVAVDNSPAGQSGRSPEYVLRLPSLSEMRAAQRTATDSLSARLDSLSVRTERVTRATSDLAQTESGRSQSEAGRSTLSYEESQKAREALRAQQALMAQADSLKSALKTLQESAAQAGLDDAAWRRRLDEVQKELDRALTPELREALFNLQEALKQLDPRGTRDALKQMADAQRNLRDAIERSRELFRRAAVEGDLTNLAQEAKDLAREQQEWNQQQAGRGDSARSAEAERQLQARTDSLAAALERTATDAAGDSAGAALDSIAATARQAAGQMAQAAQSAQQGQRQSAQRSGENAAHSLQPLGGQLDQQRQQMQQSWRKEVTEAIDQALSETSRLSQRELSLQEGIRSPGQAAQSRSEQAAVEEGVRKVLDRVRKAAGKNALVSPQISAALAAAQQEMQQTVDALSTSSPDSREAGDHAGAAVDALNAAAYQLVQAQSDVSGAKSGSGMAEAMDRMSQLAKQQGQIGQQGQGLLPMPGGSALQQQLQQLAAQQAALGRELEKLRAGGSMPGAGAMADEANDLARQLQGGRIDRQTVERQQRLFRRMLDAGRTLQGQEDDSKRQATTARDGNVHLPPALQPGITQPTGPRMPGWDELQRLSPEQRKIVVDYFQRLQQESRP